MLLLKEKEEGGTSVVGIVILGTSLRQFIQGPVTSLIPESESHFRGLGPVLGTRDGCDFVVSSYPRITGWSGVGEVGWREETYNVSATWH